MDKETYLKHRRLDIISPTLFYAYYLELKAPGHTIPITEFQMLFPIFLQQTGIPYPQIVAKVKKYYDDKFSIHILRDKLGNILQIY